MCNKYSFRLKCHDSLCHESTRIKWPFFWNLKDMQWDLSGKLLAKVWTVVHCIRFDFLRKDEKGGRETRKSFLYVFDSFHVSLSPSPERFFSNLSTGSLFSAHFAISFSFLLRVYRSGRETRRDHHSCLLPFVIIITRSDYQLTPQDSS